MQVRQQIVNFLLREHLAIGRHFVASHLDDVADAIIVGWHSTQREVLLLENVFHARSAASAGRVGSMAAVTVLIVDAAASRLLGVQSQLSVALA